MLWKVQLRMPGAPGQEPRPCSKEKGIVLQIRVPFIGDPKYGLLTWIPCYITLIYSIHRKGPILGIPLHPWKGKGPYRGPKVPTLDFRMRRVPPYIGGARPALLVDRPNLGCRV